MFLPEQVTFKKKSFRLANETSSVFLKRVDYISTDI